MGRRLCPDCLESVEDGTLQSLDGKLLCPACLPRARARQEAALQPPPEPPPPTFRQEVLASCRDRWWIWRLPLLLWFAYLLWGRLDHPMHGSWWWYSLDLGIHELGHYVFRPLGRFMGVLGGSLLQCLVPFLAMMMFLRQRDFFAIAICFGWLSENLFDVATYAADARAQRLALITPGGNQGHAITHDWHYLLGVTGLLRYDTAVAGFLRASAVASTGICLAGGSWLLWLMARSQRPAESRSSAAP